VWAFLSGVGRGERGKMAPVAISWGTLQAALLAHGITAHPWRTTSVPVNRFGSDYLWHSKKDLVRNLLWVIALISELCRKSSEYVTEKM
jgi:hypothetical protein